MSATDRDVLIGGLSAVEVVLGEELGQLRLDAAERLVLAVEQHHQVGHGERLAHQHQQLSKEPWETQIKEEVTLNPEEENVAEHRINRATCGVLRADEDVGGLGQPLHELSDALRVVLSLAQGAHHGAQDATNDASEQLRVQRLCCCCGSWVR